MTDAAPLKPLKIDFVSDVMCPWCAVGLGGLEQALERLQGEGIAADITFTGRAFPIEEPRFTWRVGPRTVMDLSLIHI